MVAATGAAAKAVGEREVVEREPGRTAAVGQEAGERAAGEWVAVEMARAVAVKVVAV